MGRYDNSGINHPNAVMPAHEPGWASGASSTRKGRTKRPRAITNWAANAHAGPGERIIEFSDDIADAGGLISIARIDGNDGRATLHVHVYHIDEDKVTVSRPGDVAASAALAKLQARCDRLRETVAEFRRGEINAHHMAARVEKIANEIAGRKDQP